MPMARPTDAASSLPAITPANRGIGARCDATGLLVDQLSARQELPGTGYVQDVDVFAGFRQWCEWFAQAHDPQRGGIEHRDVARLDDVGALDAAVALDRHADHQQAADAATACLVGIVEVADAFDPIDPAAQVGRVFVLLGAGRDELALGPLRVAFGAHVDFGGEARHRHVAFDLLRTARQWHLAWRRCRLRPWCARVAARAADHPGLGRRLWRGRLPAHRLRCAP